MEQIGVGRATWKKAMAARSLARLPLEQNCRNLRPSQAEKKLDIEGTIRINRIELFHLRQYRSELRDIAIQRAVLRQIQACL